MSAYKFDVEMSCSGCSNALTNVLKRNKDKEGSPIENFFVSLENQTVGVLPRNGASLDAVQAIVAKPGKTIKSSQTVPKEVVEKEIASST